MQVLYTGILYPYGVRWEQQDEKQVAVATQNRNTFESLPKMRCRSGTVAVALRLCAV
jgi:hypothetical protein